MVVIGADKTDGAAAQRVGLIVEDMNARSVFHQHYLPEIVIMLGKIPLRQAGFDGNRSVWGNKKIITIQ